MAVNNVLPLSVLYMQQKRCGDPFTKCKTSAGTGSKPIQPWAQFLPMIACFGAKMVLTLVGARQSQASVTRHLRALPAREFVNSCPNPRDVWQSTMRGVHRHAESIAALSMN
jgi:hypothetical protein